MSVSGVNVLFISINVEMAECDVYEDKGYEINNLQIEDTDLSYSCPSVTENFESSFS